MSTVLQDTEAARKPRFEVGFATTLAQVQETQALRYRIFAGELGAKINGGIDGGDDGLDQDGYDRYCRHLSVRDSDSGKVIACTRILTDDQAPNAGGFYSEGEFDLAMLDSLAGRGMVTELDEVSTDAADWPASRTHSRYTRNTVSAGCRLMEIGRTCVDAGYRNGAVIATLWQGIAATVTREGFDYLFGCASIGLEDGGSTAHTVLDQIRQKHMAPDYQRVRPFIPLPAADVRRSTQYFDDSQLMHVPARVTEKPKMPPLLKAYLSLGAKACGEAYWDREFNCADVFMLLNISDLNPRYARHFLGKSAPVETLVAGHA